MSPADLNLYLQIVGSAAGVSASLWAFMKWGWPSVKAFFFAVAHVFAAIQNLPHVLDTVASINGLSTQVALIRAAVFPNGGSSIPDSQKRIEATLASMNGQLMAYGKNVNLVAATLRATTSSDPRMATFETGPDGLFTDINKTFTRWTGTQPADLLRWGWLNTVLPADRPRVRAEYEQGIEDCRQFSIHFNMVSDEGTVFPVDLTATPIPELTVPCDRYLGQIRRTPASVAAALPIV